MPAGSGAKEDYPAAAKPRGVGRGVQGRLPWAPPLPPPPPLLPGSEAAAEGEGARGSPGRRDAVKGPELRRLLRERLGESDLTGVRSAWQGVELVWWVLRALVARMDLGGMGPLVARALDPRRMTLARKDAAGYGDVAIPFYEWLAHRHEFLIRAKGVGRLWRNTSGPSGSC